VATARRFGGAPAFDGERRRFGLAAWHGPPVLEPLDRLEEASGRLAAPGAPARCGGGS
jgi:hypothetical protein